MAEPKGLDFSRITPPQPAPPQTAPSHEPGGLHFPPVPPDHNRIAIETVRGPIGYVDVPDSLAQLRKRSAPSTPKPVGEVVVGGDPRVPAMMLRAAELDAQAFAAEPFLRGKLENFLKLKPTDWLSWGQAHVDVIAKTGELSARLATKVQTANAARWADETRTAYQRGTSSLFGKKPDFYKQMLDNAKTLLVEVIDGAEQARRELNAVAMPLRLDLLVLQTATEGETDALRMQLASGRQRTLVTNLSNLGAFGASLEGISLQCGKMLSDVQQLIDSVIPMWIAARGKA